MSDKKHFLLPNLCLVQQSGGRQLPAMQYADMIAVGFSSWYYISPSLLI